MIGFPGSKLSKDQPICRDIVEYGLGGVILFNRCLHNPALTANISTADQVQKLCHSLQELSGQTLLVGVDQEGGMVRRLRPEAGFADVCSAMEMGDSGTKKTGEAAQTTAAMLAASGINCNFAPVVDIKRNPDNPVIGAINRSFSDDPCVVFSHAATWITEHRKQGIMSCVKHFPGHGSSTADSHVGFVDVTDVWDETELIPYRELHKLNLIDAVMTGHLFNRRIDPDYPATMSDKTINGLLRRDIGYDGVVFSDDLQMRAITDRYPFEEAVCRTLSAGVDMLVFGNNLEYDPDVCPKAINAIMTGLKKNIIGEEQIQNALRRVQILKQTLMEKDRKHE